MTDNSSGFLASKAYNTLYLTILEAGTALSITKDEKSKHYFSNFWLRKYASTIHINLLLHFHRKLNG